MNLRFSFNLANEEFMKIELKDTSLSQRNRNALMRVGFKTVGDVVNAVTSTDDLLGKGEHGVKKIRNMGEKSAKEVIPVLYDTYISTLDEKGKQKAMGIFLSENEDTFKRHPELGVITLNHDIFRKFLQSWG